MLVSHPAEQSYLWETVTLDTRMCQHRPSVDAKTNSKTNGKIIGLIFEALSKILIVATGNFYLSPILGVCPSHTRQSLEQASLRPFPPVAASGLPGPPWAARKTWSWGKIHYKNSQIPVALKFYLKLKFLSIPPPFRNRLCQTR